jgi:uncharacterized membrane-anchored protein
MSSGILTEASNIAKSSVVGVNPFPSIIAGITVFMLVMLVYIVFIDPALNVQENTLTYNSNGCALDSITGKPISVPIYADYARQKVIGQNNCLTKSSSIFAHIGGLIAAVFIGAAAGRGIYKLQFYFYNPKLASGLYATDMLLGRR